MYGWRDRQVARQADRKIDYSLSVKQKPGYSFI